MQAKGDPVVDVIYGLHDRPPLGETVFVALQHLLAVFVPIITPPLIICGALGLDLETTGSLVSMALLASGLTTLVQVRRVGPVGSGLLSIQGTSFSFLGPVISAGKIGGLPLIFGVCLAGSAVEIVLSRFLLAARRVIPPLVSGIVVTLIGLTLIKVGIESCAGGGAARADGTFGSMENLGLAAFVLVLVVALNRSRVRFLRMSAIVVALAAGYGAAAFFGRIDTSEVGTAGLFHFPLPFRYGLRFGLGAFVPIALIYLITAIETIGDLTATSMVSGEPIEGPVYMKRISSGVLGDGVGSALAAVLNSFPNTTFSQNNGVIQLTGVASRHVGYVVAGLLVLLGLFPAIGTLVSRMPPPVLGGATLVLFGTIAGTGVQILSAERPGRRAVMVMAVAFAVGLGVEMVPDVLAAFPSLVRDMFGSGIAAGGAAAIVTNLLIPERA